MEPFVKRLKVKEMLTECEHYFISWLGFSKIQKESIPGMAHDLFHCIRRIKDDTTDSHNDSNSVRRTNSTGRDNEDEEKNSKDSNESSDQNSNDEDAKNRGEDETSDEKTDVSNCNDNDEEISYNNNTIAIQQAVAMLMESFIHIQIGDISIAKTQILLCTNFLKLLVSQDRSLRDFVPGFDFLKVRLEANLKLQEDLNSLDEHELQNFSAFDELPDKSKAIIYLAKWKFVELTVFKGLRKQEGVDALEKVSILDPTNFTWHFVLCVRSRFLRRELYGPHTLPDEKEINASITSVELSESVGGLDSAMCKAGLCQTIAEVVSWRFMQRCPNTPFHFGQLHFDSNEAAVNYLKKQARDALSRYPVFRFPEYTRYSEIFSSSLPREYRNYEISMIFMTFSLRMRPRNSKANHKMGTLYLLGDNDMEEAISFFQKAVELHPNNFSAWMDLLPSLLQSPLENTEQLDKAFKTVWESEWTWNEKQCTAFKFLHGCYFFMKEEKNKAIQTWISIYPSLQNKDGIAHNYRQTEFQNFRKIKSRYHWSPALMRLWEVQHAIHELVQKAGDSLTSNTLKILEDEIIAVIARNNSRRRPRSEHVYDASSVREVSRGNYYSGIGNNNSQGRNDYRRNRRPPSPANWRN